MSASQYKRIRAKLEHSAKLAGEASALAKDARAGYELQLLTARAADDARSAVRDLDAFDARMSAHAEQIAREMQS